MKKLNIVDIIIVLGVIIALFVCVLTTKHFRQTADKQIEATSPITFQVFLRGVTVTGEEFPIKSEDKTFITIRNVPYTELDVVDVTSQPRQTFAPSTKNSLNKLGIAKATKNTSVTAVAPNTTPIATSRTRPKTRLINTPAPERIKLNIKFVIKIL